jgi:hypothetical protein
MIICLLLTSDVGESWFLDFPARSRVQVLLQFNFAETCYYLSKTGPKKKTENTERMHTEKSTQREWREKETQRKWEGGVHREMRAREAVELKNSCASLNNKYGEWIFTSSCSSRRGGKSWRSANDEEEKKKLAPNLNCEEEEKRARSLQVCGWRKGRRLGERKSSNNAKLGRCSVYIKHALLRRRLSLLAVLPLSVSGN